MRNSKHDSKYESMNAEQLNVELLKLELQKMQFSLDVEKEQYLLEKKSNEPVESTEDLLRRLKRNREKRKRKALLALKNKTSETKIGESTESPV
jgi:hypothetical protein